MQNKKNFFSIGVFVVLVFGVFVSFEAVQAANKGCLVGAVCNNTPEADPCAGTRCPELCNTTMNACAVPVAGSKTTAFGNPITYSTIDGVATSFLNALETLVVTLSIIFIVIGGILYMISGGVPARVTQAKNCWLFSVIGLAIVVGSRTFLKEVLKILGGNLTGGGIENALTTYEIATNTLNFLLSMVGIIAVISLTIAGGMYLTAYGEEKQTTAAKNTAKWAIIGIALTLGSLIIIKQVEVLIKG